MNSIKLRFVSILTIVVLCSLSILVTVTHSQGNDPIYISAVDWSDGGNYIAAVGLNPVTNEGYIFVFDAITGHNIYSSTTIYGGYASVDWSPNNSFIAVGSYDQTIKVINVLSGEAVTTLAGHRGVITSIDWNSDGLRLVSSSPVDQQVILWNMDTYQQINIIQIGDPWSVAFSPDNQRISVGGLPGLFVFPSDLHIAQGEELSQYRYSNQYTGSVAWSNESNRIAFGTQTFRNPVTRQTFNPQFYIVDSGTGTIINNFEVPQGEKIFGIEWSPNDDQIATYSVDGLVRVWQANTGSLLDGFVGNSDYIETSLSFSPYGGRLAYGGSILSDTIISSNAQTDVVDSIFASGAVQIVVPDPSVERLEAIAAACDAPTSLMQPLAAQTQALSDEAVPIAALDSFVAQLDALPEDTIPPGCAADLRAVAEAIEAQMETP